jgi:hypothetical protein
MLLLNYCFDADPDPSFYFDGDSDLDPDPSQVLHVLGVLLQQCHFTLFYVSPQRHSWVS